MARETGKQRSQRIEIDYFRKRTDLQAWRTVCILVGLVGAGLYAAYVLASGGGSQVSTGPVAEVHAAFESDCQQCHQDFTPLDARGAELNWSLVGLSHADSVKHMDATCQTCHDVGDHHRHAMTESWQLKDQNCSGCHADHRGRLVDLTNVAASKCTDCHAGLSEGCSGTPTVRDKIMAFTKEAHGEFASLTKGDPGRVKFDHQQHMLAGQVDAGAKGAFTLSMLSDVDRERYRMPGQQDDAPVELSCSSCHKMSGNPDSQDSLVTDAELGRYLAPISFEQHCQACHSLNPGIATADTTPLPHAVPWSQVDLLVKASLAGTRLTEQARTPRDDTQTTPVPGEGLGDPSPGLQMPDASELQQARQRIQTECLKCHEADDISDEAIKQSSAPDATPLIPSRWFNRGLYDHAVHRQIDCAFCHAEAHHTPDGQAGEPKDHQTVMISNIESCTGCHRDAESPTPAALTGADMVEQLGGMSTWASDNCTLCHRYHTTVPPKEGSE
jgi:cytochrome c1